MMWPLGAAELKQGPDGTAALAVVLSVGGQLDQPFAPTPFPRGFPLPTFPSSH